MMADPLDSTDAGWDSFYRRYSHPFSNDASNAVADTLSTRLSHISLAGAVPHNFSAFGTTNVNALTTHTPPSPLKFHPDEYNSANSLSYPSKNVKLAQSHHLPVSPVAVRELPEHNDGDFDFDQDLEDELDVLNPHITSASDRNFDSHGSSSDLHTPFSTFSPYNSSLLTKTSPVKSPSSSNGDSMLHTYSPTLADRSDDRANIPNTGGLLKMNSSQEIPVQMNHRETSISTNNAARNLYVDQLPIPFSEMELRCIFNSFGPIEKLRVATDPATGEQMGYGFVMFASAEDAAHAISALHNCQIGHKTLHVSLAKQKSKRSHPTTPSSGVTTALSNSTNATFSPLHSPYLIPAGIPVNTITPNTNVYMAGIPHHYGKAELDDLMSHFGRIVESRVLIDKQSGENRGIGFVRFDSVEDAQAAILGMNGQVAPGGSEVMVVKLATDKNVVNTTSTGSNVANTNNANTDRRQPSIAATQSIQPLVLASKRSVSAVSESFALSNSVREDLSPRIASPNSRPASAASFGRLDTPSGLLLPPHHTRSMSAVDGNANAPGKGVDLFVFHLPVSVTEEDLHQLFGLYGPVTSVAVMRDRRTGEHKGYGFVTMLNRTDAENAVQYLTGFALGSKYLKVSFKTQKPQASF